MDDSTIFDDTLFSMLRDCKTLPNFLDTIFGFLKRRTDFYVIASEPKSPIGLPAGWAEHFVKQAFFKWKPPDSNEAAQSNIQAAMNEVVINDIAVDNTDRNDASSEAYKNNKIKSRLESTASSDASSSFTTSQSYNGAVFDNYTWSQNITDVDIIVKLPENTTSKDLSITILPQSISVKIKSLNSVLLEGELCQKVKHNDAMWSIDKNELEMHLDKLAEIWWDCLIKSEPKLDVTKIDCSRPFEELPEEAQAKIEELTWNQERKRLGLPTSDQLAMQDKLKKAWDAEGSPFKGPYDPNTVIITP
ncbi:hypothetical protein ILUMI_01385 [Ignelater luminosus]|uniref:Nuclear migration protein nudC n=1 Tax=Ignelater luminosus TaxID=2038154 RepID=A0A8K0DIL6_IGNLU|nr:hypothetical protein ILUMI_01385 [Ignelater luminosus]